jgi:hypothetical protein
VTFRETVLGTPKVVGRLVGTSRLERLKGSSNDGLQANTFDHLINTSFPLHKEGGYHDNALPEGKVSRSLDLRKVVRVTN